MVKCYIKLDQIVFVMSAKGTGAAESARSMVQLLNCHSDVRESVEEVMQTIENDGLLAKDDANRGKPSASYDHARLRYRFRVRPAPTLRLPITPVACAEISALANATR